MRKRSGPEIESWETPARTGFHNKVGNSKRPLEIYLIGSSQEDHKFPRYTQRLKLL